MNNMTEKRTSEVVNAFDNTVSKFSFELLAAYSFSLRIVNLPFTRQNPRLQLNPTKYKPDKRGIVRSLLRQ